jgi:hypothetical protein
MCKRKPPNNSDKSESKRTDPNQLSILDKLYGEYGDKVAPLLPPLQTLASEPPPLASAPPPLAPEPPPLASVPPPLAPVPPPPPPPSLAPEPPYGGPPYGGPSYSGPSQGVPLFSTTSDHKLVYLKFKLLGIAKRRFTAMTYNMSFLSDLGPKKPPRDSTEETFLSTIMGSDKRIFWKRAATLVKCFMTEHDPDIMFFQEMNDRNKILIADNDVVTLEDGAFKGGYQALLEFLSGGSGFNESPEQPTLPSGSYYRVGSFNIGKVNYSYLAYSIQKGPSGGPYYIYPTVLTIWKTEELGEFENFYGNDLGNAAYYTRKPVHLGRNFSCVRTNKSANLVNIHGPNDAPSAGQFLKPAIEKYLLDSYSTFKSWIDGTTVIGGDTNDGYNLVKSVFSPDTLKTPIEEYKHMDPAPKSCCFETPLDTLTMYKRVGDKIYVANPDTLLQLYEEAECLAELSKLARGKRKRYRSLKKRKRPSKTKQPVYNKKTARRPRFKDNKKTARRPRFKDTKKRRPTYNSTL